MGLKGGSHLLQAVNGQMLRAAKSVLVAATMDTTIGHPARPALVAIGAQTPLLSQEAERVKRCQPCKPLRRIGRKSKLSDDWTDDHIGASRRVSNERKYTGTASRFHRDRAACWTPFGIEQFCTSSRGLHCWRGRRFEQRRNERFQHREALLRAK